MGQKTQKKDKLNQLNLTFVELPQHTAPTVEMLYRHLYMVALRGQTHSNLRKHQQTEKDTTEMFLGRR